MKAVVVTDFGSPDNMEYVETDRPAIGPGQVLIRVKTTCVNYADIKARYGRKGQGLPFIPGLEAAGVVESIGADVRRFHAGQRVIAFPNNGSYAEYVTADEKLTFAVPDGIDFDTAGACGIVSFLSYKLLSEVARLETGETVLIHSAAGGVGTTAVQMAKALGAGKVFGTVGNENKIPTAENAGADHVICYETEDFAAKVNELTEGKGVQIVLDSIAGEITGKSLKCLAPYGRLVIFGDSGGTIGQVYTSDLHSSCRSVLGFSLGTTRKQRPESLRETADQVFRLIEEGRLDIKISERLPLKDAAKAHQWVENRNSTGKIILYTDH